MMTVPPSSHSINKFNESETEADKEANMTHTLTHAEIIESLLNATKKIKDTDKEMKKKKKDFRREEKLGAKKLPTFDLIITFAESLSCAAHGARVVHIMLMCEADYAKRKKFSKFQGILGRILEYCPTSTPASISTFAV